LGKRTVEDMVEYGKKIAEELATAAIRAYNPVFDSYRKIKSL